MLVPVHVMRLFRVNHPAGKLFTQWITGRAARWWRGSAATGCRPDPMRIASLNVGAARAPEIDGRSVASGIVKRAVEGEVAVKPLGLAGDEQADLSVHGGLAKAVYAYPAEHYPFWQTVRAQARAAGWGEPLPPGFPAKTSPSKACWRRDVCVGDVLRFARLRAGGERAALPCFKFNAVMGFAQASKLMFANGWCGFYLSVRAPGTLRAGELFEVIHGPREVGIVELFRSRAALRKQG